MPRSLYNSPKTYIATIVLFLGLSTAALFSCRKKNDPVPTQCYIVSVKDSTTPSSGYFYSGLLYFISYDANGRISSEVFVNGDTMQANFTYGDNVIIKTLTGANSELIQRDSITLNSYGLITGIYSFSFDSAFNNENLYFYDNSGHLIRSVGINSHSSDTFTYQWANGNIISSTESNGFVINNQYTNRNDQLGDPDFIGFANYGAYIAKNKNLPAGNYTFDNSGKITSVQLPNSNETITYQYKCY